MTKFQGSEASRKPRINLSFKPACEQKKNLRKKDCLLKSRFIHPAEFFSYKITISLRLTRGLREASDP